MKHRVGAGDQVLLRRFTLVVARRLAVLVAHDAASLRQDQCRRRRVVLAAFAAIVLSSKNLTAQTGMGQFYELFAIAMAVIGGVSLTGGRGSIIGTVLGAMVFGAIQSGFTYIKLDAFYQLMAMGSIIISAVVLDQWRQQRSAASS